jgi:hypothetical protein
MKTQHEIPIQFSGYPLRVVETKQKNKGELTVVHLWAVVPTSVPKIPIANDPKNWDVEWFNSYE